MFYKLLFDYLRLNTGDVRSGLIYCCVIRVFLVLSLLFVCPRAQLPVYTRGGGGGGVTRHQQAFYF